MTREVKTAILILSCITIFIFGFSFLKGTSLLNNEKIVHALYHDIEGLVVGANITISGLNVGKVKKIDFDPKIMIFGSFLDVINFTEILVKINFTEISVISTEINNLGYALPPWRCTHAVSYTHLTLPTILLV